MSDTVIQAEKLGKMYTLGERLPYKTLKETLGRVMSFTSRDPSAGRHGSGQARPPESFWALRDISFELERGETLGIIGSNGAGKSTLLKLLSRVTEPTEGVARLHGRCCSLLEVGTGFHPELTGRENVYLNGAILGMKRSEITRRFDEIAAFAEIDRFLDTPVKRYSSGMYVRLAFAVAAHLEPEILIVDEVLAVGDAAFQNKCLDKMGDAASGGRTVLFVSHNMKAISSLCSRAILLDQGQIAFAGPTSEALEIYSQRWSQSNEDRVAEYTFAAKPDSAAPIQRMRILNSAGEPSFTHDVLEPIDVELDLEVRQAFPTLLLACEVRSRDGSLVFVSQQSDCVNYKGPEKINQFPTTPGLYRATMHLPAPLLNAGEYELEVYVTTGPLRQDTESAIRFEVVDNDSYVSYVSKSPRGGLVVPPVPWEIRVCDRSRELAEREEPEEMERAE